MATSAIDEVPQETAIWWYCCAKPTIAQHGPVIAGYALALRPIVTTRVGDRMPLQIEMQHLYGEVSPAANPVSYLTFTIVHPDGSVAVVSSPVLHVLWYAISRRTAAETVSVTSFTNYWMMPKAGTYVVSVATTAVLGDKRVVLTSNPITIVVFSARPGNRFVPTPTPAPSDADVSGWLVGASRHTAAGKAVDGIALALSAPGRAMSGRPVSVVVELRNATDRRKQFSFVLASDLCDFIVRDLATGKSLPQHIPFLAAYSGPGLRHEAVDPRESLYVRRRLDTRFDLRAGTYDVRATRAGGAQSNWMRLEIVKPGP